MPYTNKEEHNKSQRESYRKMRKNPEKLKRYRKRKKLEKRKWRANLSEQKKEAIRIKNHNYYEANKERFWKSKYRELRLQALQKISGLKIPKCKCGCDDLRALQINHLEPEKASGVTDYKKYGNATKFYKAIVEGERKVDDLEVVCRVCNAKHHLEHKFGLKYEIIFLSS